MIWSGSSERHLEGHDLPQAISEYGDQLHLSARADLPYCFKFQIQLPYRHIFVFDGGAVTSTRDARGAFATTTSRNIYRVVRRERLRQRE